MGDAAIALTVGLVVATVVAFRRFRGVVTPEARREVARQSISTRTRVAAGVIALVGIVWVTRQLFT